MISLELYSGLSCFMSITCAIWHVYIIALSGYFYVMKWNLSMYQNGSLNIKAKEYFSSVLQIDYYNVKTLCGLSILCYSKKQTNKQINGYISADYFWIA